MCISRTIMERVVGLANGGGGTITSDEQGVERVNECMPAHTFVTFANTCKKCSGVLLVANCTEAS